MTDLTADSAVDSLTQAVKTARRGLRSDIERLIAALDKGELLIPLSRNLPDAPEGERVPLSDEFVLVPHLLRDAEGLHFAPLFTTSELLAPFAAELEWDTEGEELKYCSMPGRLALDVVLEVVDEERVLGLVLNPGSEYELFLRREELASIVQGKALPLVGYVQQIPAVANEATLEAEPGEPPPPQLIQALETFLKEVPAVLNYRVARTFNRERDLEPHLTLTLRVTSDPSELDELGRQVSAAIDAFIPPPGYVDILWEVEGLSSGIGSLS